MYVYIHTYMKKVRNMSMACANGMCNASAQHATVADDALLSLPAFSAPVHLRFISHHSGSCLFSMMFRRLSVHTYRVRLVNLSTFLAVLLGHASSAPSLLCTGTPRCTRCLPLCWAPASMAVLSANLGQDSTFLHSCMHSTNP